MRYLSVCSGIEAATSAWHPLGWHPVGFAEIEPFPSKVLAHHYGSNMPGDPLSRNGVPNFGDFTAIDTTALGPVDLLVGGTPCQDFSVAGLRAGLSGDRGNLTLQFLELVKKTNPTWIVWENVPGVISDKTEALKHFLDGLEELGYVVDIDILDAQFFGLAQRRRRVFICAQRSDAILKAKTLSSCLTMAQCLAEILRFGLGVLSTRSQTGFVFSESKGSKPIHSLKRRMKLFGLLSPQGEAVSQLQDSLDELQRLSGRDPIALDWVSGSGNSRIFEAIRSRALSKRKAHQDGSGSTEMSWSEILEECLASMRLCITSTVESATTESRIYTCALMALRISGLITQSMESSPTFWSAASLASTALREFISYARSASSDLFGDVGWVHAWRDFIEQAEQADKALGNLGIECFGEVLPLSAGVRRHPPSRGEAGAGVAVGLTESFGRRGGVPDGGDTEGQLIAGTLGCRSADHPSGLKSEADFIVPVVNTLTACGNSTGGNRFPGTSAETAGTYLIAHALRGEGFDASEDGTGRGTPIVPICFDPRQAAAIEPGVVHDWAVRRLTPVECEILQGFPAGHTAIPGAADGPRYKALGNSFAVPVVRWIGERIQAQEISTVTTGGRS